MLDVSRGHERKPIPIFNGADDDPAPNGESGAPDRTSCTQRGCLSPSKSPNPWPPLPPYPSAPRPVTLDFTYVTECVVNEGLRLLLGGPLRDPWPCPYLERPARKPEELAYSEDGLFLHPAHTIDSVYECTLASGCGMECKNRLVQHGPKYRLEVIRCLQRDGRFAKGWGVRSPDFIPRGSFINECVPTPDRAAFITSCRRLAASPPPPSYLYLFLSLPCCPPRCASIGTSESTFLTTRLRAAVSDTTTRR